ncbi:hypothetical protein R69746_08461 [Paraburkholderia aspalathi]|nr:hypothetical protein R75465_06707 [Paraburkholderia aspalathi]CAE6871431.1 hypothetical protein R69746_08461 [Paraburkholderia aspalathi]
MLGAALRENRFDSPITQLLPAWFGVVSAIGIDDLGLSQRSTVDTTDGRDRFDEGKQLCEVVSIGIGQGDREWQPICVSRNMAFGTRSRTIDRVRPDFWPAPIARTDDESRFTCERPIWSAMGSSASSSSCNRSYTPAFCQSRKRRPPCTPELQPISAGRSRQRNPVRNTYKMPFKAVRSGIGFRPRCLASRSSGCGSKGSIRFRNSSSITGLPIPLTPRSRRPRHNSMSMKLTVPSRLFGTASKHANAQDHEVPRTLPQ